MEKRGSRIPPWCAPTVVDARPSGILLLPHCLFEMTLHSSFPDFTHFFIMFSCCCLEALGALDFFKSDISERSRCLVPTGSSLIKFEATVTDILRWKGGDAVKKIV